jgi:glycosyltransferase involved in cell wall biosynthesis
MNKNIKVSIVVPTYNREEPLKSCINSLLIQNYPKNNYEIIIVDDASSDGTEKLVKDFIRKDKKIRYFKQNENKGSYAARNIGIKNAKGEIIGFTDDDCIADKNWIREAVELFDKNKDISGIQGTTKPFQDVRTKYWFHKLDYIEVNKPSRQHPTCNMFYKRKIILNAGLFDERFRNGGDEELAWRLKEKGYNIIFSNKGIVYHQVRKIAYMDFIFKKMKFHSIFKKPLSFYYYPLFYKKHPKLRKKFLFLNFINNNSIFYISFLFPSLISILYGHMQFGSFFGMTSFILYLFYRRSVYWNGLIKVIVGFPVYIILDFISIIYAIIGSIKFKSFVI